MSTDTAAALGWTEDDRIDWWAREMPGVDVPEVGGAVAVPGAMVLARSQGEDSLRRLLSALVRGVEPDPLVSVSVRLPYGSRFDVRPDILIPGARLAIEYDGPTHQHRQVGDEAKDYCLTDAGWDVIRVRCRCVPLSSADLLAPGWVNKALARRVARRVKHGLDEPLVRFTRLRDAPGLLVGHNQVLGRSVDHLTTLECVAVATGVLDSSTHWDRCHRVAAQWDSKANGAPITAFHPMEWRTAPVWRCGRGHRWRETLLSRHPDSAPAPWRVRRSVITCPHC